MNTSKSATKLTVGLQDKSVVTFSGGGIVSWINKTMSVVAPNGDCRSFERREIAWIETELGKSYL